MTDRDDALRRELGWTGPEDSDYEPAPAGPEPTARPAPPVPSRPPIDFVEPDPDDDLGHEAYEARDDAPPPPPPPPAMSPPVSPPPPPPEVPPPFREPDRPGGSFRQPPARYGPPPGSPRDTGPVPTANRPGAGTWNPPANWPPPRPPRPPAPPGPGQQQYSGPPTQQWSPDFGPEKRGAPAAPAGSYADRIRTDDLVPARKTPPGHGWRLAVYKATFGLVNLGQSPDELRQLELEAKIRAGLRGHYKVGVMGKGGVGKTTVSASIGSVFAELRQDDRVVAIDADTAFGKLGSRVDPKAQGSYWELAQDPHLETFADVRGRVGNNSAGLFVLAGEATPARRRVLDPAIYREATSRLDRYFTISIIDCSSTMDTPVTQEVLRDLDALVVVSSPWVDGAAAAGQTMDWLADRRLTSLLQRTIIVLNDSDGHADKRTRSILAQQFAPRARSSSRCRSTATCAPAVSSTARAKCRLPRGARFVEIAAALADYFPTKDDRSRERF